MRKGERILLLLTAIKLPTAFFSSHSSTGGSSPNSDIGEDDSNVHIRVVIAGGDVYINHVLRVYVDLIAKKPRDWQPFSFFIIPIGLFVAFLAFRFVSFRLCSIFAVLSAHYYCVHAGKKNDIAMHLASVDSTYRSLFFTPEWRDIFEKDEITDGMQPIKEPQQPPPTTKKQKQLRYTNNNSNAQIHRLAQILHPLLALLTFVPPTPTQMKHKRRNGACYGTPKRQLPLMHSELLRPCSHTHTAKTQCSREMCRGLRYVRDKSESVSVSVSMWAACGVRV